MAEAITFRMVFLLVAAAATGGFGVVVLAGNRDRTANRFLAAFLFLIAANHVAEFFRAYTTSPAAGFRWYQLASVFSALDPLLLYYFASVYPERNSLNDTWKVAAVTAATVVLALFSVVRAPPGARDTVAMWGRVLWSTVTVGIYLVVLVSVVRRLETEGAEGPLPLLVAALSVVTLPAIPRVFRGASVFVDAFPAVTPIWGGDITYLVFLYGAVPITAAALWRGWASEDPEAREALKVSLWAGMGLTFVIYVSILDVLLTPWGLLQGPTMDAFKQFSVGAGAAIRWIAFSALVSQAIVRHDMLGMTLKARRRTARTLVATAVVGTAGIGLLTLRTTGMDAPLDMAWSDLVFLGALAALTQGFQDLIDRAAHRFYGVPPPGDQRAAIEVYREAVAQTADEGSDLGADPRLRRLEEELDIEPDTARTIREMETASSEFALEPGGEVAGRYRVTERLGETGAGSVCLARDELLDRDVVLKPVEVDRSSGKEAALDEARNAGGVQHPNILAVYDVVEGEDAFVLVTEHAAQGSLAEKVREQGPLDPQEGVRIVEDVLDGLQAVHEEGLVHRDVKPSNVLLTNSDVPKVSDFGVAQVRQDVSETFDEADVLAGTPAYMAPEQRRGEVTTPQADIFAVGRLMGRCLEDPLPGGLQEIQERALEDVPEDRWESASAMREALHEWRQGAREGAEAPRAEEQ